MGGLGSDAAIEAADVVPVSYTHLDVYKRQVNDCALIEGAYACGMDY